MINIYKHYFIAATAVPSEPEGKGSFPFKHMRATDVHMKYGNRKLSYSYEFPDFRTTVTGKNAANSCKFY